MNNEGVGIIIILLFYIVNIIICAAILDKKNRSSGYISIAIFVPLIGLIVALCLDSKAPLKETISPVNQTPPPLPPSNTNSSNSFITELKADYEPKSDTSPKPDWEDLPTLNSEEEFI